MALRMLCRSFAASSAAALGRTCRRCPAAVAQAAAVRQIQSLASRNRIASRPQIRAFASSPLADILKDELDYENENEEAPEELADGPPKPFQLTESAGDTQLLLKRQYNGETIEISTSVNDQPEPEEMEPMEGEEEAEVAFPGLEFEVAVIKGSQRLAFECMADGEDIVINRAALEPVDTEVPDSYYYGPVYQELDDKLQEEFAKYLHERGVDQELGNYLIALVNDKEQQEYKRWLGNVRKFIMN